MQSTLQSSTVDCAVNNAKSLYSLINIYITILKSCILFWHQKVPFLFSLNDFIETKTELWEVTLLLLSSLYGIRLHICIWIDVTWYRPQTQKGILTSQVRLISLSGYLVNTSITWHVHRTTYGPSRKSTHVYDFIDYLDIFSPLQAFPSLKYPYIHSSFNSLILLLQRTLN